MESGGATVSAPFAITDDIDGNPRFPNPGFPNNPGSPASAPDIGADEFAGIMLDLTPQYSFAPWETLINCPGFNHSITDATACPPPELVYFLFRRVKARDYAAATARVQLVTYPLVLEAGSLMIDFIIYCCPGFGNSGKYWRHPTAGPPDIQQIHRCFYPPQAIHLNDCWDLTYLPVGGGRYYPHYGSRLCLNRKRLSACGV